jgi:hypothetical protein
MKPLRYSLGRLLLVVTAWAYFLAYPQLCVLIASIVGVGVALLLSIIALQLPVFVLLRASGCLPGEPKTPCRD